MKTAKVLWILPLALSSLLPGQIQTAVKLESSNIQNSLVRKADTSEPPSGNNGVAPPSAFFSGAEAGKNLATAARLDDGMLAAYQAIAAARDRIRSNAACEKFFHYEGEQALDKTRFTMQYPPTPTIAAQVDGNVVLLNRNPNGPFMKPPEGFAGLTDQTEIRAFYILHELAHELSRYTKYVIDHGASAPWSAVRVRMNNELLIQNCYKSSRSLVAAR